VGCGEVAWIQSASSRHGPRPPPLRPGTGPPRRGRTATDPRQQARAQGESAKPGVCNQLVARRGCVSGCPGESSARIAKAARQRDRRPWAAAYSPRAAADTPRRTSRAGARAGLSGPQRLAQQPHARAGGPKGHQRGAGIEQLLGAAAQPGWGAGDQDCRVAGLWLPRCGTDPSRRLCLKPCPQLTTSHAAAVAQAAAARAPRLKSLFRQASMPAPFTAVIPPCLCPGCRHRPLRGPALAWLARRTGRRWRVT